MLGQAKQFIDPTTWRNLQLIEEIGLPPEDVLRPAPIDLSKLATWPAQIVSPPSPFMDWLRRNQTAVAIGAGALFLLALLRAIR